jgi:hypothetical protein
MIAPSKFLSSLLVANKTHVTWSFYLYSEPYPICNDLNKNYARFPNNVFLILHDVVPWGSSDVSDNFAADVRLKNNFLISILNILFTAACHILKVLSHSSSRYVLHWTHFSMQGTFGHKFF